MFAFWPGDLGSNVSIDGLSERSTLDVIGLRDTISA